MVSVCGGSQPLGVWVAPVLAWSCLYWLFWYDSVVLPSFSPTAFAHKFCFHCNTTTLSLSLSLSLVACYHPYHLHCQHTKSPTGIHQVVETAVDRREIVSYPRSTTTTHTTIVLVETHSSSNPNQRRRRPDTKTILLGRAENVTYCQTSAVHCRSLVKTAKSTWDQNQDPVPVCVNVCVLGGFVRPWSPRLLSRSWAKWIQ